MNVDYDNLDCEEYITTFRFGHKLFPNTSIFVPKKKKKSTLPLNQKLLVDTEHLMELLDCGKHMAIEIGTKAEAKVCFGRKLFWNVNVIQRYIDRISSD